MASFTATHTAASFPASPAPSPTFSVRQYEPATTRRSEESLASTIESIAYTTRSSVPTVSTAATSTSSVIADGIHSDDDSRRSSLDSDCSIDGYGARNSKTHKAAKQTRAQERTETRNRVSFGSVTRVTPEAESSDNVFEREHRPSISTSTRSRRSCRTRTPSPAPPTMMNSPRLALDAETKPRSGSHTVTDTHQDQTLTIGWTCCRCGNFNTPWIGWRPWRRPRCSPVKAAVYELPGSPESSDSSLSGTTATPTDEEERLEPCKHRKCKGKCQMLGFLHSAKLVESAARREEMRWLEWERNWRKKMAAHRHHHGGMRLRWSWMEEKWEHMLHDHHRG